MLFDRCAFSGSRLAWAAASVSLACAVLNSLGAEQPLTESPSLTIAAAADLQFALGSLAAEFRHQHPDATLRISYGSSGNFYAQLNQHAPFDMFFSADIAYPEKLIEAGLAGPESKFTYAVGRLVLWASTNSSVDPAQLGALALMQPGVHKVAIANPEHAPYGKAAVAALKALGLEQAVKDKLVLGENVAQTAQFVQSGAADLGFIALSLATAPPMKGKGRFWEVPLANYPTLEQGAVILKWAKNPVLAEQFKTFIGSPRGKSLLREYGFSMPNDTKR